jgi:two-component system chemotaxis response regulator CheB
VRTLPVGLPASLFVVCHFPADARSVLPEILSRAGALLATHAADGQPFYPGHIYVAPPNHHLLLSPGGTMRLTREARENGHRPAIDPLFRSAARYYGDRVAGVILTGALHDGAAGLMAVRASGGVAIVQDPEDADVAGMPRAATLIAGAEYVVPLADLASLLADLVHDRGAPGGGTDAMDPIEEMPRIVDQDMDRQERGDRRGEVSVFTCPGCGGALWQVDEPGLLRFRCHVGHSYNAEVLLSEQAEALEAALWTSVRTFREQCVLSRQLAMREREAGNAGSAVRFEEQAEVAERNGKMILDHLLRLPSPSEDAVVSNG